MEGDEGAVTAEMAVALPTLVAVLVLMVSALAGLSAQLRCIDAAREGARAVARGETDVVARSAARREAPRAATIHIGHSGATARVVVEAPIRLAGVTIPQLSMRVVAAADREPQPGGAPIGSGG